MKKILTTAILILCIVQLFAQQASLNASVSKSKVALSERFQLTITLNNGGSIKDFRPPAMADFMVMGGPNQSVSYTHLRAHETVLDLVCRLLLEKKNTHSSHLLLTYNRKLVIHETRISNATHTTQHH